MDVRDRLREIFQERHINCASFAPTVGMSKQQLYDCFAHRRRLEASELLRICYMLSLSLNDFQVCLHEP